MISDGSKPRQINPAVGMATKMLGGVLGGIGNRRAQKRSAEHGGKVAQSRGMISYSNFGGGSQVGQMRDRMFQAATRDPRQLAAQENQFARGQFADAMNMAAQRSGQHMNAHGFEGLTGQQQGLQRAVLSRMMAPGATLFADQSARSMRGAQQYQDRLLGQEYGRGMNQHDNIASTMTGGGGDSFNAFAQPMYAGLSGAVNHLQGVQNLNASQDMFQRAMQLRQQSQNRLPGTGTTASRLAPNGRSI